MTAQKIIEEKRAPFVSADKSHTDIGFSDVANSPELRRAFYLRNGVLFTNGVILGLN